MKIHISIIVTVFSFLSCNDCSIDEKFEEKYRKCIGIVKCSHTRKIYWVEKTRNAATYLANLTQRELSEYYWEYACYKSDSGYFADMKYWSEWFEANKCKITLENADSIANSNTIY